MEMKLRDLEAKMRLVVSRVLAVLIYHKFVEI